MESNLVRMPPPNVDRQAQAVAELTQLYAALEEATRINQEQERTITRQQDRIAMLEEDLRDSKQRAQVCERKLIRLASNQRNISRIAQDGDEIMRSVQEWVEPDSDIEGEIKDILERAEPENPFVGGALDNPKTPPV